MRKILAQEGLPAEVDMDTVRDKHPRGESIPDTFWAQADLQRNGGDLLETITRKNIEVMIKMLRELDATSTGGTDEATYNKVSL